MQREVQTQQSSSRASHQAITSISGGNCFAVGPTRQVWSSSWWGSGNCPNTGRNWTTSCSTYNNMEGICYNFTKYNYTTGVRKSQSGNWPTRKQTHACIACSRDWLHSCRDHCRRYRCSCTVSLDIPCPVYQKCGTQTRTQFLDIGKLARIMGASVCDALIGLHVFSGCDTVSTFAGRGKISALRQMTSSKTYQVAFSQLGQSWEVPTELFQKLQGSHAIKFVCTIYQFKSSVLDGERWSPVSFHHVKTASSCRSSVQTISLIFGVAAFNANPLFPVPKGVADGRWWQEAGHCLDAWFPQHQMQCCNSFPASVWCCELSECTCLSHGLKCTDMCKFCKHAKSSQMLRRLLCGAQSLWFWRKLRLQVRIHHANILEQSKQHS